MSEHSPIIDGQAEHKRSLRTAIRTARVTFAAGRPSISPPPEFRRRLGNAGVIAAYLPLPGEADPTALVAAACAAGYRLALPHVTARDDPMRFLAWSPGDPLHHGPFGLHQPAQDAPVLIPDIVLTPLVAFDARLNRLGQGAGYYDRVLAALPAVLRIGVAWSMQRVDRLPVDPWDVPLHGVITERGWIDPEPE